MKNIWRRKATVNRHKCRLHDINLSGLEFTVNQENEGLIIKHTASIVSDRKSTLQ